MSRGLQVVLGLGSIAGLLALQALVLYLIWWVVMIVVGLRAGDWTETPSPRLGSSEPSVRGCGSGVGMHALTTIREAGENGEQSSAASGS
ncbi:MAG: hypothetical protein H0U94_13395 [Acidobacteria bacterium]|nr:hypothetical protein [Acidobacteriota bacterium]